MTAGNMETPTSGVTVTVTGGQTTIWPSMRCPGYRQGPDNPVELGVKFYSEVGGTIKGIRFYKSIANTGTHIGNLWWEHGQVARVDHIHNETASGWQQANFATPVPINCVTIYVASYHANSGHYSADENYFSVGRDNSPLHAPVSDSSRSSWGPNGVYAYGASSAFPTQTYNRRTTGWTWCFRPGPAPTLTSIAVTPSNPASRPEQHNSYGDGDLFGRKHANYPGNLELFEPVSSNDQHKRARDGDSYSRKYNYPASQSGVTGTTTLTVQTAQLAITTPSLPGGTVGSPYSQTLAAGGDPPLHLVACVWGFCRRVRRGGF